MLALLLGTRAFASEAAPLDPQQSQVFRAWFVRIDIPADSGLSEWPVSVGLKQVDTVAQMVRGTPPQAPIRKNRTALIDDCSQQINPPNPGTRSPRPAAQHHSGATGDC